MTQLSIDWTAPVAFDRAAFNASERARGEQLRRELGPGWNVFNPETGRWEWRPTEQWNPSEHLPDNRT